MSDLRRLLENNFQGHKLEINDYCKGHLNPAKLQFPREVGWNDNNMDEKTQQQPAATSSSARLPIEIPIEQKSNTARGAGAGGGGASSGTTNFPIIKKVLSKNNEIQIRKKFLYRDDVSRSSASSTAEEENDDDDDDGGGEDIHSPASSLRPSRIFVEEYRATDLLSARGLSQSLSSEDRQLLLSTMPFTCFTHKDAYKQMRRFRDTIIREQDTMQTKFNTGWIKVAPLEEKLRTELQQLGHEAHSGPNFMRLQVFSNVFDDVITGSPMFGQILHEIKREYDSYVNHLLDDPATQQHSIYRQQLDQLLQNNSAAANKTILENLQKTLETTESNIRELWKMRQDLNKRKKQLVKQINDEIQAKKVEKERKKTDVSELLSRNFRNPHKLAQYQTKQLASKTTHAHEIDLLNAQCWRSLQEMDELQEQLRDHCSPVVVIQQLTEILHDTEIAYRTLNTKFNQINEDNTKLFTSIENLINQIDMRPRDREYIDRLLDINDWQVDKEIFEKSNKPNNDDAEDASRWNWYID